MQIKLGQYGTKHGHAAGKARAVLTNPDTELVGVYEPDPVARAAAQRDPSYAGMRWLETWGQLLDDSAITAVVIEGRNDQSLAMAQEAIAAGKHIWYDKPAGDDWPAFERLVAQARERSRYLQMGYMFRFHDGFRRIADWARSGFLGEIFTIRAHMSTNIPVTGGNGREVISRHQGGIFYDLGGHMLDQITWILGRPRRTEAFFRNDATADIPSFADNTLGVLGFDRALAFIDIAAMEVTPMARRFEVYGTRGSAILEPFEPDPVLRLCLAEAGGGYAAGLQDVPLARQPRLMLYERELAAFVGVLRGEHAPDRGLEHELLVQETLLRTTGRIPGG